MSRVYIIYPVNDVSLRMEVAFSVARKKPQGGQQMTHAHNSSCAAAALTALFRAGAHTKKVEPSLRQCHHAQDHPVCEGLPPSDESERPCLRVREVNNIHNKSQKRLQTDFDALIGLDR